MPGWPKRSQSTNPRSDHPARNDAAGDRRKKYAPFLTDLPTYPAVDRMTVRPGIIATIFSGGPNIDPGAAEIPFGPVLFGSKREHVNDNS
jgi:hypothetical protein